MDLCRIYRTFWAAAESCGVSRADLLRHANLPLSYNTETDLFMSTRQYFLILRGLEDLSRRASLGTSLIPTITTNGFPAALFIPFVARNLHDALSYARNYAKLNQPEYLKYETSGGEFYISSEWIYATASVPPIAADLSFSYLMEVARRGSRRHIVPRRVELKRDAPRDRQHEVYFGCRVHFNAPRNVLVLNRDDLDSDFLDYNADLIKIILPALENSLRDLHARQSLREEVKRVLKRTFACGRPAIRTVARELCMGERTLQRRITEEGTSFRTLLLEARQELARELLSDQNTTVEEAAYLLGFCDAKSFYRAFRDQEGMTPNQWRRTQQAARGASTDRETATIREPRRYYVDALEAV